MTPYDEGDEWAWVRDRMRAHEMEKRATTLTWYAVAATAVAVAAVVALVLCRWPA